MPTLEEINRWADDLERECPDQLPQRLEWVTRRLGIELGKLLRLMGFPPDQAARLERGGFTQADWEQLVAQHEAQALWVEEAINHLLAVFHYQTDALADRLKRPPIKGEVLVPRLGGLLVDLQDLDETEREQVLLEQIAQSGPGATAALLAYLSQPTPVWTKP